MRPDLRAAVVDVVCKGGPSVTPEKVFQALVGSTVTRGQVRAALLDLVERNEVVFTMERTLKISPISG